MDDVGGGGFASDFSEESDGLAHRDAGKVIGEMGRSDRDESFVDRVFGLMEKGEVAVEEIAGVGLTLGGEVVGNGLS